MKNQAEINEIKIRNAKEMNELDMTKSKHAGDLMNRAEDIKR